MARKAGQVQVLHVAGGVAPPCIVCDDANELRPERGEIIDKIAKNRLVANGRGHARLAVAAYENLALILVAQPAGGTAQVDGEVLEQEGIGQAFYARHELAFVVHLHRVYAGFQQQGRIVDGVVPKALIEAGASRGLVLLEHVVGSSADDQIEVGIGGKVAADLLDKGLVVQAVFGQGGIDGGFGARAASACWA